jgi:hypothetical protein
MTEEELRKAMMNAAPKPSLEARLEYLEADASAQRTAILRLEKRIMWLSFVMGAVFAALGIERMFL